MILFLVVLIAVLVLLAVLASWAAVRPDYFPRPARRQRPSSAREDLSVHRRLPQLGAVVAVRKAGPRHDENLQRRRKRERRRVSVGG